MHVKKFLFWKCSLGHSIKSQKYPYRYQYFCVVIPTQVAVTQQFFDLNKLVCAWVAPNYFY